MKKYTHILWDFNGTIYDDVEASWKSTNILLRDRNMPQVADIDEMRLNFGFPVKDYYQTIGFDYKAEPYETIANEWMDLYLDISSVNSSLMPGVRDVITNMKKRGLIQTIISACEVNILLKKLRELGIYEFFSDVGGTDNVNAQSKTGTALEWRRRNPEASAVMIGDTIHDFEVAKLIGVDCILFSGGYQSRERLIKCGCPVIDGFDEIDLFIN